MKRALTSAIALLICVCLGTAWAQTTPAKTTPTKAKTATTPPKPATTTAAGPLKKDGTPDMRYKANKTAAKPAGPLKKDGTPDMRYKANKTTTPPPPPKKTGTK